MEDGSSGHHTTVAGQRAEPDVIGVLVRDQRPRSNHRSKQMMIVWELVKVVDVVGERCAEPDVFSDDFGCGLHGAPLRLLVLANAPTGVSSRARFLRDGECYSSFAAIGPLEKVIHSDAKDTYNAPAIRAPLPSREQPVTAILLRLMLAAVFNSRPSMIRETPQTHAVIADAEWVLPYKL